MTRRSYSADDWTPPPEPSDDLPLFLVDAPLPYAKGSDTSREAAEEQYVAAMRDRRLVLSIYRKAGPLGLTADEASAAAGLTPFAGRPRVTELRQNGYLEYTGEKRRNVSGCFARVLRVKEPR